MSDDEEYADGSDISSDELEFDDEVDSAEEDNNEKKDSDNSDSEEDSEDEEVVEVFSGNILDPKTYSRVYALTKYEAVEMISARTKLIDEGYKTKLSEEERGETYRSIDLAIKEYKLGKFPKCTVIREMPNGDVLNLEYPKMFSYKPVY